MGMALLAGHAGAQDTAKVPGLDESKIPDWVKRQAASPQKFIINSTVVKAKAEPPKPEPVVVRTPRQTTRKLPPLATETTAPRPGPQVAPEAETASAPADAPVNMLGSEATEQPPTTAPSPAASPAPVPTAAVSTAPPALTQPLPAEPGVPSPAPASAPASAPAQTLPEPSPVPSAATAQALVLLEKVDPALTPDLIDGRLAEASVTVAFTVGTKGEVLDPQVTASSDRRLNRAVLRAVADWHYAPVNEPRPHSVKFTFAVTP